MMPARRALHSPSDLEAMRSLASRARADCSHVTDLPYRFASWALDDPANVALWEQDGRLQAWAALQTPFWMIDLAVDPGADPGLFSRALDWALERAWQIADSHLGHPSWFVSVFEGSDGHIRVLESAGFVSQADIGEDSWGEVVLRRNPDRAISPPCPPPGLTLRPLAGRDEAQAYVDLHRDVFGTANMTLPWRERTLAASGYVPGLDVVAKTSDGRLAGFCVAWLDEDRIGQIEPMGVHEQFRNRGLGRALLTEVLLRLRTNGAKEIFILTDGYRKEAQALYLSAGFEPARDILIFRKDLT